MTDAEIRCTMVIMSVSGMSATILKKLLSSEEELPVEAARYFLKLSLSQADLDRISVLSEKANEGELDSEEKDELHLYVLLADFLTIMHLRAEDSLRAKSPAA